MAACVRGAHARRLRQETTGGDTSPRTTDSERNVHTIVARGSCLEVSDSMG